jgi:hypothetical protein
MKLKGYQKITLARDRLERLRENHIVIHNFMEKRDKIRSK